MLELSARYPWPTLALVLLVTAGAVVAAMQVEPQVDFIDTVPESTSVDLYRAVLHELDGARMVAIYMPLNPGSGHDSLRGDEGFDALVVQQQELTDFLSQSFPGAFSHSLSVYEAMRQGHYMFQKLATAGNPQPDSYSIPRDPVTYDLVRDQVREQNVDDVLADNGQSAILLMFLQTRDDVDARATAGAVADAVTVWSQNQGPEAITHQHQSSGLLVVAHETDERNQRELAIWGAMAAAGVSLALWVAVRRPANVLIAVGSMGVATAWTFGLMGVLGIRISFLTLFLAPLITGVGVDYAVHLLHRFEEERDRGCDRAQALKKALVHTGPAIALAAVTTAAGLGVLVLVPEPLFAEIAGVAALGILLAWLASLTVAPALRAVLPRTRRPRIDRLGLAVNRVARVSLNNPKPVLACLLVLTAGAAVAASFTEVASGSSDNELPQDDPQIVLRHRLEAEYGAFERAYIVVRGDWTQPDALRHVYSAVQSARQLPLYLEASSITDLLVADAATDDGALDVLVSATLQPSDEERLPATAAEARDALDALYADPLWRTLAPFTINRDYDLGVVAIRIQPWGDQAQLRELRDALQAQAAALAQALGPEYSVAAAGSPINRAAVTEQAPWDVALATVGAAVIVGVVLAIAWRKRGADGLRVAGLATAMVLLCSLWLLASIPLLDAAYDAAHRLGAPANTVALSQMFLLAFAITVAVGVDDVVHLASRFWENRDRGRPPQEALRDALEHTGRAITGTTLTTFTAFALLAGVYFLQSKNLAILTALGVLYAYALTLALAPHVLLMGNKAGSLHGFGQRS